MVTDRLRLLAVAAVVLAGGTGASWHPIHASSAQLSLDGSGFVRVDLRVYEEDFPPGRSHEAAAAYLGERFRVLDSGGRPLSLRLEGLSTMNDMLVLHLSMLAPRGLAGHLVWHGVLAERFGDQVNLVRARYGHRTVQLVFFPGDGPKRLP